MPVPANFVGRSCAELDLRNRYGVTVLLIKKVQGHEAEIDGRVPDAGYRFAEDDVMLAMGSPNDLRGLENAM